MELENRVAFITGPAKGLGAAATLKMADQGADLVLAGRDLEPIEEVAGEARRRGRRVVVVGCDVGDQGQVEEAVRAGSEAFEGRIDILVNIAGGSGPLETSFVDTRPEDFDDIVRVNMRGCFLTMRAMLPIMKERRYGKIVNVGGTFGLRGRAFRMAYSATKWGLRGITKSAALEFGEFNINVNGVCPGMVDGPRFERVCTENAKRLGISIEEARRRHGADYALKRVSTADDVAEAILFFASDRSRNITGQDLAVDGGWVI
jgi:NAD(P)-dependent dehydrogenase (short-subunit alcohol dehydrogenase family)